MFNESKLHMVPPAVQDKASQILNDKNDSILRENYALQFETIIDYCQDVLKRYEKAANIKRHK